MNVDAAMSMDTKVTGFGCVIRNDKGEFLAAREQKWHGCFNSKVAEAISIREALRWLKEKKIDNILVETDALLVIKGLKVLDLNSSFSLILEDIRKLANDFLCISFSYVKRSANMVAHKLAREAMFIADCREWSGVAPPLISDVILSDISV